MINYFGDPLRYRAIRAKHWSHLLCISLIIVFRGRNLRYIGWGNFVLRLTFSDPYVRTQLIPRISVVSESNPRFSARHLLYGQIQLFLARMELSWLTSGLHRVKKRFPMARGHNCRFDVFLELILVRSCFFAAPKLFMKK